LMHKSQYESSSTVWQNRAYQKANGLSNML
jgi:hypothetical protein